MQAQELQDFQAACFGLDEELYAIDIMRIREIIRPQKMTRVLKAPDFVEGVINLRGTVIPVISLRKRFDLPQRGIDARTKLLIVSVSSHLIGLVVDEVSEVLTIPVADIKPPPRVMKGVGSEYLIGVCLVKELLISLLNIDRLLTDDEEAELGTMDVGPGPAEGAPCS